MAEIDPLVLEVLADVRKLREGMNGARRMTDIHMEAMERRGVVMTRSLNNSFNLASKAALQFAAGLGAIQGARAFLAIADEAKQLEAQLRLATAEFGTFTQAQDDVRRIAADTRAELSSTAALYGNFARNARDLGISQDEVARATETVAKTFKISGAGSVEAAQSTRQLVQALQSGVLRGDEFNSVMEAAPRLSRLLADSLGVTVGELRKMAEEGELTSDKLVRAFTDKRFTAGIDDEFRQLPVTFGEAMTQVQNAAVITFGAFDRGGQFSTALANFVTDGAGGFRDLETAAEAFGISVRSEIDGIISAFAPLLATLAEVNGQFSIIPKGNEGFFHQDAKDIDKFTGWLSKQGLGGSLMTGNGFDAWWNNKPKSGTSFEKDYLEGSRASRSRLETDRRAREYAAQMDRAGLGGSVADWMRPSMAPPRPAAVVGGKKAGRKGPSAETLAKREAAEAKRAENERLREIREEASSARDAARLDDDILAAKAALATAASAVLQFQLDAIESERRQRVADIELEYQLGKQTEAARKEADRRILVNSELASLQTELVKRRAAEAAATRAAAAQRDEIDTLKTEASLIETREKRRDAELRILDLAYKEEEAAIRRAAAAGQIADLDEALANMKRRQASDTEGVNQSNESPYQRYARGLNEKSLEDRGEELVVREIDSLRRGMNSAITNAMGIENDFFSGLIEILLDEILFKPLANALDQGKGGLGGGGGLLGGIVSGIGGLLGFGRASGGAVTGGQMYRVNEGASPGRVEGFVPQGSGTIIPLGMMNQRLSSGGQQSAPAVIQISVGPGQMFEPIVRTISGEVSIQYIQASADGIAEMGKAKTIRHFNRPTL